MGEGASRPTVAERLSEARAAPLPRFVAPALATLVDRPPSGPGWLAEMKFDGYRILARLDHGKVTLKSRNENDWTAKFASIARAVAELDVHAAYLDGEVAVVRPDGTTSFQALQNLAGGGALEGALVYFVFDLLHLDGFDLTRAPLEARKELLDEIVKTAKPGSVVRYASHVVDKNEAFFAQAGRHGLEGIVCKRRDGPYLSGRGRDWVKVKCIKRQEFVVGGFTEPEGSRPGIGGLLVGVYDDVGSLVFAGGVGTGFSQGLLRELRKKLDRIARPTSPFSTPVVARGVCRWVEPVLVAEVAFSEWTDDDRLRHPSFQGMRDDKDPRTIVRERPADAPERPRTLLPPKHPYRTGPIAKPARSGEPPAVRRRKDDEEPALVAGVRITNPSRVVYPELGLNKLAVARFYEAIAPRILPGLVDRPTTLVRCPEGVHEPCFYQKHRGYWAPDSIRRVSIREKTKVGEYLVVDDVAALVGLAQIGILEIHTWNAKVAHLETPDRVVFDLDPGEDVAWERIVAAALAVRDALADLGLESFVKTTGGKGLHVVAPLTPSLDWEVCAGFSLAIAKRLVEADPRAYTLTMGKTKRVGKIYLDTLRNVRGATSVAAYSTRARANAPMSLPLSWQELVESRERIEVIALDFPARCAASPKDPWAAYVDVRQRIGRRALASLGLT
jgi:bifunctional non-homologous end joining protein LigD